MVTRDIFNDLASLLHPLPEPPGVLDEDEQDVYDQWVRDAEEARAELAQQLRDQYEVNDVDPLLGAMADARAEIRAAEYTLRLLLAYGREWVEPRPYTLDTLAKASGYSVSGVRTAYDDPEIVEVAKRIGAKIRRRVADDEATPPAEADTSS